jgi:hypothetical protein
MARDSARIVTGTMIETEIAIEIEIMTKIVTGIMTVTMTAIVIAKLTEAMIAGAGNCEGMTSAGLTSIFRGGSNIGRVMIAIRLRAWNAA